MDDKNTYAKELVAFVIICTALILIVFKSSAFSMPGGSITVPDSTITTPDPPTSYVPESSLPEFKSPDENSTVTPSGVTLPNTTTDDVVVVQIGDFDIVKFHYSDVLYIVYKNGGITPYLNSDGSPMTYEQYQMIQN